MNTCPPSPIPPWHRPTVSPITDTLVGDGTISIATATTYLAQTTPKDAGDLTVPYVAVMPDGNYKQQRKIIQIPAASVADSALWRVTGNFVNFVALQLNNLSPSAELIWDGAGWHWTGGAAEQLLT